MGAKVVYQQRPSPFEVKGDDKYVYYFSHPKRVKERQSMGWQVVTKSDKEDAPFAYCTVEEGGVLSHNELILMKLPRTIYEKRLKEKDEMLAGRLETLSAEEIRDGVIDTSSRNSRNW